MPAADQRKMLEKLRASAKDLRNKPKVPMTTKKFKPPKDDSDSEAESKGSASGSDNEQAAGPGEVASTVNINWPATLLLIGKKFCGKTNAILNICRPVIRDFHNVYVITTTKHKNNLNDLVVDPEDPDPAEKQVQEKVLESLSEPFLEALLEHQRKTDAKTLLIFDDFIGIKGISLKHSPSMKLLASSGRNFNVSMIFSTQDAVEMMTTFRRNGEYVMIGDNDADAIDLLGQTMADAVVGKRMMKDKIIDTCLHPYEFLFIAKREKRNHRVKFPLVKE